MNFKNEQPELDDYYHQFQLQLQDAYSNGFHKLRYFHDEHHYLPDGSITTQRLKSISLMERKRLAKWKLASILRHKRIANYHLEYEQKQKHDILLNRIQREKIILYTHFKIEYAEFLSNNTHHLQWYDLWLHYFRNHTTHNSSLHLFSDDELLTWYHWQNGIYL